MSDKPITKQNARLVFVKIKVYQNVDFAFNPYPEASEIFSHRYTKNALWKNKISQKNHHLFSNDLYHLMNDEFKFLK